MSETMRDFIVRTVIAALVIAYIFSPIDFMPGIIIDDAAAIPLGLALSKKLTD